MQQRIYSILSLKIWVQFQKHHHKNAHLWIIWLMELWSVLHLSSNRSFSSCKVSFDSCKICIWISRSCIFCLNSSTCTRKSHCCFWTMDSYLNFLTISPLRPLFVRQGIGFQFGLQLAIRDTWEVACLIQVSFFTIESNTLPRLMKWWPMWVTLPNKTKSEK